MKKIVLLLLFLSSLSVPVGAEELPSLYRGGRPLGMGNAFTAVSNDAHAIFYNPAGIPSRRSFSVLNPLFEVSEGSIDFVKDLKNLQGGSSNDAADFLSGRIGEHYHLASQLFPYLLRPSFQMGILARVNMDMEARNPVFPEVSTNVYYDAGLVIGAAHDFGRGLSSGAAIKYIRREGVVRKYTANDIVNNDFDPLDDLESASDFAIDLGGLAHLSEWTTAGSKIRRWDPTFGLVVQNITDLDFKTVGVMPMQVNAGIAIHPAFWSVPATIALDVKDIGKSVGPDDDMGKRTDFGMELQFKRWLSSVRLGVHQGYFSAGMTARLWILNVDIATYAEELGVTFRQRENRRTVVQLSGGF
ncbi:MAG: hypothetical protein AAB300_04600 [Nitrospirota bacterium]|mgnify:CR=1 FL=1